MNNSQSLFSLASLLIFVLANPHLHSNLPLNEPQSSPELLPLRKLLPCVSLHHLKLSLLEQENNKDEIYCHGSLLDKAECLPATLN